MTLDENIGDDLNAWIANINKQIVMQRQAIMLRTSQGDTASREKMQPFFQVASDAVSELERRSAMLKSYIATEQAELNRLASIRMRFRQQTERIAQIRARLPKDLSTKLDAELGQPNEVPNDGHQASASGRATSKENLQAKGNKNARKNTPKSKARSKGTFAGATPAAKAKQKQSARKAPAEPVSEASSEPYVRGVTEEQLRDAPQYVKGRLTLPKIDKVVEKLNSIITAKYQLLARPHRDLNSADIDAWQTFHDNECPETAGEKFITDGELKDFGAFKMDATARSVINVLRHVGSLKEVRGKNKARIFIVR